MDLYEFYKGQSFTAYEDLGAHLSEKGVVFRTFAPNARRVSLLLHQNELLMRAVYDGNFYELEVESATVGDCYEFRIYHQDGTYTDHCDPYGFQMQLRPAHKSIVCQLNTYRFHDQMWMRTRSISYDQPMNIYELHLGSWQRKKNGEWYGYRELAELLPAYLKQSRYNYVEFMPVCEHPCDESWGYQNTGYFAATSRYGSPQDLMKLIDSLHQNDIGVILDFVPVHFALDEYGLAKYDGTALYEYPHPDVGISEWGSCNFMHPRGEVQSFLQSSVHFWLSVYHFDGIRMDAVSRIIYWQGDRKRGENGYAIDFLKKLNLGIKHRHGDCILIAEDSTDYPNVTKPVPEGGLGFDYKWDMGWMHDTLAYFQLPPFARKEHYHKLTFSMMYFANERYLLPLSHDEVVHGKATVLQKMNGNYEDKFPQARAMYLFMAVHPGKKLNFMGNEFGQLREWDERRAQDWELRKYPNHDAFYHYFKQLNAIYLSCPALWEQDYCPNGFSWIDCHQEECSIYVLQRNSQTQTLIALFNFSDEQQTYELTTPVKHANVLINSDWQEYGGITQRSERLLSPSVLLPKFSGMLIKI